MILGDTNSRIGRLPDVDVCSSKDLEHLEPHTGVAVSGDDMHMRELSNGLPVRKSQDRNANAMGRELVHLCRSQPAGAEWQAAWGLGRCLHLLWL